MSNFLRTTVVIGAAALGVALVLPAAGASAKPSRTPSTVGYDVSYPQCGTTLPTDQAFGIVGVNGGLATKPNPCLAEQLVWASRSSGAVESQPGTQLYVNTANPGEVIDQVTTWPTSGGNATYGACNPGDDLDGDGVGDGDNSLACSWQYGWERAQEDVAIFRAAAVQAGVSPEPGGYVWWLDVETTNTWQSGSPDALARNRATLEGMTDFLTQDHVGASVGIYSTNYQWGQIAGAVPADSSLYAHDSWMAGARTLNGAKSNCGNPPLTAGGTVVLAQYVSRNLDHNYAC